MEERVRMKSQLVEKYKDFLKYRGENMDHHYENVSPYNGRQKRRRKPNKRKWNFESLVF